MELVSPKKLKEENTGKPPEEKTFDGVKPPFRTNAQLRLMFCCPQCHLPPWEVGADAV